MSVARKNELANRGGQAAAGFFKRATPPSPYQAAAARPAAAATAPSRGPDPSPGLIPALVTPAVPIPGVPGGSLPLPTPWNPLAPMLPFVGAGVDQLRRRLGV